jgi:DNA-binding beta-propeller fold protein YncE
MGFRCATCGLAALALTATVAVTGPAPTYRVARRVELGGEGGWDYLTVDPPRHRIFIARATRVMVVDTDSGQAVGEIADTPGVHGVALAPDLGRGFSSNGRENAVGIFDLQTLKPLGKVKAGENPDAILYEPDTHRVFAFNGRSGDATVIDGAAGSVVGTVPLGGKPEAAVSSGGTVFVNVEDKSEIVSFDAQTLQVRSHWPLKPCEEPTGLALDRAKGRLFAGCSNKVMAVVDAKTGQVLATPPIGGGVDGTAFDQELGLAFSTNGEGTVTVVGESTPGHFDVVQTVTTEPGARTIALDPGAHVVYTATAKLGVRPPATASNPRPRAPVLPGTFVLLVVSR